MAKRDYSRYGLTVAQWLEIYKLQNKKCPICQKALHKPGNMEGRRAASVDHDHTTGRVRGLLCYRCNRFVIGRNNAERAKRVYEYLTSKFDGRDL